MHFALGAVSAGCRSVGVWLSTKTWFCLEVVGGWDVDRSFRLEEFVDEILRSGECPGCTAPAPPVDPAHWRSCAYARCQRRASPSPEGDRGMEQREGRRRRLLEERLKLDWEQFDRDQRRSFDRQLLRARLNTPTSSARTPASAMRGTTTRIGESRAGHRRGPWSEGRSAS